MAQAWSVHSGAARCGWSSCLGAGGAQAQVEVELWTDACDMLTAVDFALARDMDIAGFDAQ